ncbi:(2Fe-2S) ferredoxin domain-containing protein [Microtetraspora sp. NBRC 13810]|uniref:(2Fe-2S) ferredoxin domain-containing protein n=1 Tax=Microtetraspora sp. NBRC 13810 TaxID=3030990 RepID=UPI00255573CD|nr:(2Fe-2S) ferredoxin domain-containing protein [Microtetraspora sp. NBRC 13810]
MNRITVCRGCCCGSVRKVPAFDHDDQVRRLSQVAEVRVTDCLDVCEQANVVIVHPSPAGRLAGGRPVWLGLVNQPDAAEDIAAWIAAGGPGLADPPEILTLHTMASPGRNRARAQARPATP